MVAPASVVKHKVPTIPFEPVDDYMVFMDAPKKITSGIVLPDAVQESLIRLVVVAAGPGSPCSSNPDKRMPLRAEVGEEVYVGGIMNYFELKFEGVAYRLMSTDFIRGKVLTDAGHE